MAPHEADQRAWLEHRAKVRRRSGENVVVSGGGGEIDVKGQGLRRRIKQSTLGLLKHGNMFGYVIGR